MSEPESAGVADALDVLERTPRVLHALLTGASVELRAAADGDWTATDVVAHLASLDPYTLEGRVRSIVTEADPSLADIDENKLLSESGLATLAPDQLLTHFATRRAPIVAWLRTLDPRDLLRSGMHQTVGALTAVEIINHKAWHDLEHTRQICAILALPEHERSGAMRRFH